MDKDIFKEGDAGSSLESSKDVLEDVDVAKVDVGLPSVGESPRKMDDEGTHKVCGGIEFVR